MSEENLSEENLCREEMWLWLNSIKGIGRVKITRLIDTFGDVESIYHASTSQLKQIKEFRLQDIYEFVQSKDVGRIQEEYSKLTRKGVRIIVPYEGEYPERLKKLCDHPTILYVLGKLPEEDGVNVGIVGARECSSYGREVATYFGRELAREGVQIISGLARGIDEFGHRGVLEAGGYTLGVLGSGIDYCYPQENIDLYQQMEKKCGIISEHGLGVLPISGNFPKRNRIISALSDGVLVVEAKERSGSLITVDQALEQGKEVFVIPGRISDQLSRGCNELIKMGAQLVTSPKEILEAFGLGKSKNDIKNETHRIIGKELTYEESLILSHLSLDPKHINELADCTELSMPKLLSALVKLQVKELANECIKNYYTI